MKRADYEREAQKFRAAMKREFQKPQEEWNIPEEWMSVLVIATCHTEGCRNNGMSLKVSVAEPLDGVYKVLCGMCNSAIEELDPMFTDEEEHLLPVRYADGSSWLKGSF